MVRHGLINLRSNEPIEELESGILVHFRPPFAAIDDHGGVGPIMRLI